MFLFQVRRHSAAHGDGEDSGQHLLPQRRARHRASGARHRLQLLPHLPPEPARRQTQSAEGSHVLFICT